MIGILRFKTSKGFFAIRAMDIYAIVADLHSENRCWIYTELMQEPLLVPRSSGPVIKDWEDALAEIEKAELEEWDEELGEESAHLTLGTV